MSKTYKVYNLYKSGQMSSKYVGINHYRRYFYFLDNIPDMDEIFKDYDIILNTKYIFKVPNLVSNYCITHMCKHFFEIMEIIRQLRPEYTEETKVLPYLKYIFPGNIFIMKKNDFIKYCDFVFQILFPQILYR